MENLIFFDLEASNRFAASSICQIGIVVCDRNFEHPERKNIIVNSRDTYNVDKIPGRSITIGVTKEQMKQHPDFGKIYESLKVYFNESNLVVGHAVQNDIKMLAAACRKYQKKMFHFPFLCTQILYAMETQDYRERGLDPISEELGIEFSAHDAAEDAYATYEILKRICAKHGLNADDLEQFYHVRAGFVGEPGSPILAEVYDRKLAENQLAGNSERTKLQLLLQVHAEGLKPAVEGRFAGVTFCFSKSVQSDADAARSYMDALAALGGRVDFNADNCQCYVRLESDNPKRDFAWKRVKELNASGRRIRVITLDAFKHETGAVERSFDPAQDEEILIRYKARRIEQNRRRAIEEL